jgi:hypothetical protein
MTNEKNRKPIKDMLDDYRNDPTDETTTQHLDRLKSQIISKGHNYEYQVAELLKLQEYEVRQSQIYRKKENEEETFNTAEIDIEAYKDVELEEKLGFLGISKFRICYIVEVKSNAKEYEIIFRVNEARKYKNDRPFPFFSLPFSSFNLHSPFLFHDIETNVSSSMDSNDLFVEYENIAASIHFPTDPKKITNFSPSYANSTDLVGISNHFKNTFDIIFDSFFDQWRGMSVDNSIHSVVTKVTKKLSPPFNNHNYNHSTTFEDEIKKFYQKLKEEYHFSDDELSVGVRVSNQSNNFSDSTIPDNFVIDIANKLKQVLMRQEAPVLVIPIVIYQGSSFVFNGSEMPYFQENQVVYSFNFRDEINIRREEYPVFLFNEFNLEEIEKITDFYKQKLLNLDREEYIIYFFRMISEILTRLSKELTETD